ncbi:MAG TPA: hypothetical protein VFX61_21390 [Micromonosporaceae bacterium]|nr:hypothetical protein [Micromonosporaceae bacterium]
MGQQNLITAAGTQGSGHLHPFVAPPRAEQSSVVVGKPFAPKCNAARNVLRFVVTNQLDPLLRLVAQVSADKLKDAGTVWTTID